MPRPKPPAAPPPTYDPASLADFARKLEASLAHLPVGFAATPTADATGLDLVLRGLTPEQARRLVDALRAYDYLIFPTRRG